MRTIRFVTAFRIKQTAGFNDSTVPPISMPAAPIFIAFGVRNRSS